MTTGHNFDSLYNFDDPLGFQSAMPPSFSLSSWQTSDCCFDDSDSEESDNEDDEGDWLSGSATQAPLPQEKPTAQAPQRESSSSSIPACVRNTRVRFSEHPQVRRYEQVDRELFSSLFYSCHELQKMIDDAKKDGSYKAD